MGMSPGARQRLDHGFRRRAAEQAGRFAAERGRADQLGHTLGLGDTLGIYRADIQPPWGVRRGVLLSLPVAAYLAVTVLLMVVAPESSIPLLGLAPFLIPAYAGVVFFLLPRRRRFTRWLYGYAGGLAEVDPDRPPRVIRWDEVTDVADAWRSSGSESSSWDYEGFRLTLADGRIVPVAAAYRNALDPYGPVGGIVAALTPSEVGGAIPRFPSIADLIGDHAAARVVTRQAETLRAGGVLVRGEMRVTRDGLAGPKDAQLTPWSAIDRIELRPGRLKVRPIAGKARAYANYRDGSGYAVLCRLLLTLGVQASFEPHG